MTYIKKEDAKTLASELSGIPVNFLSKFDSLSSIDFEEMIKDTIKWFENEDADIRVMASAWLKLLLNKLPK